MPSVFTKIHRFLSSRTLTIVLLAVFLILCVIGTLVPQEGVEPSRIVRAWDFEHSGLSALRLTRIFSTGYFAAVVVLSFVALSLSTAQLIRRTARTLSAERAETVTEERVRSRKTKSIVPFLVHPQVLKQSAPCASWDSNKEKTLFVGRRFWFARWSMVGFHLSLIVLLSGVFLDRAVFYRGVYSLVEGDYFVAGRERPIEEEQGFLSRGDIPPVRMTLKLVHDAHEQPGYRPGVASEVVAESSSGRKDIVITRADPACVDGLMVYQSPQYGYGPVFTRRMNSEAATTGTIRMSAETTEGTSGIRRYRGAGKAPGTNITLECLFDAPLGFAGVPESITVSVSEHGRVLYRGAMAPGDEVRAGSEVYQLEEVVFWADLIVSRQPWTFLLYVGFSALLLSLASFALFNPHVLYAFLDERTGATTLAAVCLRFQSSGERLLHDWVTRIEGARYAAAARPRPTSI